MTEIEIFRRIRPHTAASGQECRWSGLSVADRYGCPAGCRGTAVGFEPEAQPGLFP